MFPLLIPIIPAIVLGGTAVEILRRRSKHSSPSYDECESWDEEGSFHQAERKKARRRLREDIRREAQSQLHDLLRNHHHVVNCNPEAITTVNFIHLKKFSRQQGEGDPVVCLKTLMPSVDYKADWQCRDRQLNALREEIDHLKELKTKFQSPGKGE